MRSPLATIRRPSQHGVAGHPASRQGYLPVRITVTAVTQGQDARMWRLDELAGQGQVRRVRHARGAAAWQDGGQASLGITVTGFPSFFLRYGPNTSLGGA
jgi:hypothetical protein